MYFKRISVVGAVLFTERFMQSFLGFKGGKPSIAAAAVRCLCFGHEHLCAGQLVQRQKLHHTVSGVVPTVYVVLQYNILARLLGH